MAILNNSNAISSGGYDINNSLRFRSSASAYLNRTFSTPTNNKIWTWSGWVKRGSLSSTQLIFDNGNGNSGQTDEGLVLTSGNALTFINITQGTGANWQITTTQVLRDPSAWYHIVLVYNSGQATASNRIKLYINGLEVTAFSSATYPAQNTNSITNSATVHTIGRTSQVSSNYFDGYLTETNFIDGQALTPSSFGETDTDTGVWKPKAYTGTYGTNGFYLKFSDIATTSGSNAGLGKDFSGNANYWTTNNISVTSGTTYDAMIDSPTLTSATVANYAVMNPLKTPVTGTYSNANLTVSFGSSEFTPAQTTIYPSSGKWYWEAVWVSGTNARVGVQNTTVASTDFGDSGGWRWENGGNIYNNGVLTTVSSYATGDVLGFCLDCDAGKLYVSKNGTWQNSAVPESGTGAVATNIPTNTLMSPAGSTGFLPTVITWNFGQRPFNYTPPTGFVRLNTFNLPDSTIKKGSSYMDATLYTGTGANQTISTNNIDLSTNGLAWIKGRSAAESHHLFDSLRTLTGTKYYLELNSDTTDADQNFGGITSPTLGSYTNTAGAAPTNINGRTYVQWLWQAGSSAAASNTSGSITSTVSANTTAGFSIVTYTGTGSAATIGHGLGVAPKMIIVKNRDAADAWQVYHAANTANPETDYLVLNTTAATADNVNRWNDTLPTSTVFSIGNGVEVNTNTEKYVAYCWAAISGYSAFTSYTGNGSADGPFVYCGFRPKFVMIKRSSAVADWFIYDAVRNTYNVCNLYLNPNVSGAQGTYNSFDLVSNGFKLRDSLASFNSSGDTFIVAAWAENPFKNSNAR